MTLMEKRDFDYTQNAESYPGYKITDSNSELKVVSSYFGTQLVNVPKFYILENPVPKKAGILSKLPFWLNIRNMQRMPYLNEFAGNSEFYAKYDDEKRAFFLRSNSARIKKHELVHPFTEQINPKLVEKIVNGFREKIPSDKPFVYQFIYEGLAELVALDSGQNDSDFEESKSWHNFRLTGNKLTDDLKPDRSFLLAQFEKAKLIIETYKRKTINPESTLRKDQYNKALREFEAKPNSEESSVDYTLGYAYCLTKFRQFKAENKSNHVAILTILNNPPESMDQIKEAIELLTA